MGELRERMIDAMLLKNFSNKTVLHLAGESVHTDVWTLAGRDGGSRGTAVYAALSERREETCCGTACL